MEMREILIIGNSITRGKIGISLVDILKQKFPSYTLINKGQDADTLRGIYHRLEKYLTSNNIPEIIIIEAGMNDVIRQDIDNRGFFWRLSGKHYNSRGSIPIKNVDNFKKEYREMLISLQNKGIRNIIVTTLSCVGEDTKSKINTVRKRYSTAIRHLAKENKIFIADVEKTFDKHLRAKEPCEFLIGAIWKVPFTYLLSQSNKIADWLSRKRNLRLTIDGVHLNTAGAKIYAAEIAKIILKFQSSKNK